MRTLILLLLNVLSLTMSAKVLLINQNVNSHYTYFGRLGTELANEGHSVLMLIASNSKVKLKQTDNFQTRVYKVKAPVPFINSPEFLDFEIRIKEASSMLEWLKINMEFNDVTFAEWGQDCEDMFADQQLYNYIKSQDFDIAILDPVAYTCTYAYAYKLELPVISYSIPFAYASAYVPALPSQTPSLMLELTDKMTFMERLQNAAVYMMDYFLLPDDDQYIRKYVPEKPVISASDLLMRSVLWFYLHDDMLTYPKPKMPYTVDVADIMIREPQPLSIEFSNLMNATTGNVIIVSMGSYFDNAPSEWLERLCAAFKQIKYTMIWKSAQTPPCKLPSNIKVFKWIPQNDLLAHPKVSLFVTHCGINSVVESIGNGVPVLGFPIGIDQPHNAKALETKHYGKSLDIFTASAVEIVSNINEMMTDKSYKTNTKVGQQLLRSKPLTPGKRVSFWVDHVTRFGAKHLHSNSGHLSVLQFYMFDIFLFLVFCVLAILFVFLFVMCLLVKLCKRCCKGKQENKGKID